MAVRMRTLDKADTNTPSVGAVRLRLVAYKSDAVFQLKQENGKYMPQVLLDLDYWVVMPK
jgi:2-methylfumaryl-CoA hydratase